MGTRSSVDYAVSCVQDKAPESLTAVLSEADATKQRAVIQRLAIHLLPIMEKGLLDPVLSHRRA